LNVTVTVDDATVGSTPDDSVPFVLSVADINEPPSVSLTNTVPALLETTTAQTKVADILVTDDALGDETLGLTGPDAALFEIVATGLFLKAGQTLDFETNPQLDVTVTVDDPTVGTAPDGQTDLTIRIVGVDGPPVADAGGPYEIGEGGSLVLDASLSFDPSGDPLTYSWDVNGDGTFGDAAGQTATLSWNRLAALGISDEGDWTVSVLVRNDQGQSDQASTALTVVNLAPTIASLTTNASEPGNVALGQTVSLAAGFTDPGLGDWHTARIDWGDGSGPQDLPVTQASGSGTVAASRVYPAGGVYEIVLTVTDNALDSSTGVTSAYVAGVRLGGEILQIVGGNGADIISIEGSEAARIVIQGSLSGSGTLRQYFDASDITEIRIYTGGGSDRVAVSGQLQVQVAIDGGAGNDQLQGGGGHNLILGGDGDDVISGGNDRDLLVGGTGTDRLLGYGGDDILVAGTVLNDLAELTGLLQRWTSADRYGQRVADVVDQLQWQLDEDVETLYGGPDRDLLCASAIASFKDRAEEDISRWYPDYLSVSPVLTNFVDPCDTDRDGFVRPQDVLRVVNYLNLVADSPQAADAMAGQTPRLYLDVDMNYLISPADALRIINRLNADSTLSAVAGEGEGQALVPPLTSVVVGGVGLDASGRDRWLDGAACDVVFRPVGYGSGEPRYEGPWPSRQGSAVRTELDLLDAAFAEEDGGLDELDELLTVLAEGALPCAFRDPFEF